jgi:Icc-related predicted phosphoesterase
MSDLHQEFYFNIQLPAINPEADILLLAGDIATSPIGYRLFLEKIREISSIPIVAVLGNHEFYGHDIKTALKEYKNACKNIKDFHLLENRYVDFGDVRVIGATLWTDYNKGVDAHLAINNMTDFRVITIDGEKSSFLLCTEIMNRYKKSVAYIKRSLEYANCREIKTVVLTHHAPSYRSVHERYKGQSLNSCFVSDLSNLIMDKYPQYWVNGHIHNHMEYEIDQTIVLANPYGYPQERKFSNYVEGQVFEI